jgi:hypothetical protein
MSSAEKDYRVAMSKRNVELIDSQSAIKLLRFGRSRLAVWATGLDVEGFPLRSNFLCSADSSEVLETEWEIGQPSCMGPGLAVEISLLQIPEAHAWKRSIASEVMIGFLGFERWFTHDSGRGDGKKILHPKIPVRDVF